MYTDASLTAAAAYSHGDFLYSAFACDYPDYANQCIYVKELLAVLLPLQRWAHACVANGIMKSIMWYTAIYDIALCPVYIPSADNVIADCISRCDNPIHFINIASCFMSYYGANYLPHLTSSSFSFLLHRYSCRGREAGGIHTPV